MAVTLASNALTVVAAVTERTGTTYSTDRVTRAINVASGFIEDYLGRPLGYATVTDEEHQGRGYPTLWLVRAPLVSVASVYIYDTEDEEWTRSADFDARGKLYRASGWPAAPGIHRDVTRDPDFSALAYNVRVSYIGGYYLPFDDDGTPPAGATRLPYHVEEVAILEAIAACQRTPNANNIAEETTPGGWKRKYTSASSSAAARVLSAESKAILDAFPLKIKHV